MVKVTDQFHLKCGINFMSPLIQFGVSFVE